MLFYLFSTTFAFAQSSEFPYGKGIIYYTENYLRDYSDQYSKFDLPIPKTNPSLPVDFINAAFYAPDDSQIVVKADRYWKRKGRVGVWSTDSLRNLMYSSPNAATVAVPTANIEAAYYDLNGAFTVILGDRYWYRPSESANWYTNTLQSAYFTSANAAVVGVPINGIDAAYYDNGGGYTVIKGDKYWYRASSTANWSSNTLQNAYYTSTNAAVSSIPTDTIDVAYYDHTGGYTVIKGNNYWYRAASTSNWYKNTLEQAFQIDIPNIIKANDCSRYFDLTQREVDYLRDLKINFVILGFGPAAWYNLAPLKPANPTDWNDRQYQFSKLDSWIDLLLENNIKVVLQLWGTPTWSSGATSPAANGCANNPYINFEPYNQHPKNLNDFADFVQAIATRYDGAKVRSAINPDKFLKVDSFSLWNEPNLNDFWSGGNSAISDYVEMSNSAYSRIKAVRPEAVVWAGNLSGACCGADAFVNTLTNISTLELKFDVFSTHAYPYKFNLNPRTSLGTFYHVGRLNELITALDSRSEFKGKPLVISETGNRSNWERILFGYDDGDNNTISPELKAQYLSESWQMINEVNQKPETLGRILGVANNVLYNPWRWWSTGLINYYNSTTRQIDFSETEPAYQVFKDWSLTPSIIPVPTPILTPTPTFNLYDLNQDGSVDTQDYDEFKQLYLVKDINIDFNHDNIVNILDFSLFAEAF